MSKHEWKNGDEAIGIEGMHVVIRHIDVDSNTAWVAGLSPGTFGYISLLRDLRPLPPEPKLPTEGRVLAWLDTNGVLCAAADCPSSRTSDYPHHVIDIAEHIRNKEIVEALVEGWWPYYNGSWAWHSDQKMTGPFDTYDAALDAMLKLRAQRKEAGR